MSDAPNDRSFLLLPLKALVERAPLSGDFVTSPRLAVTALRLGSDENQSHATIDVFAGPIDSTTKGDEPALQPSEVLNGAGHSGEATLIGPDQQILIVRELEAGVVGDDEETGDVPGFQILFRGYCEKPEYRETVSGSDATVVFTLEVSSMLERASELAYAQIAGRWMRTGAGVDALDAHFAGLGHPATDEELHEPFGEIGQLTLVRARPCVFNAEGRGNRSATPIELTVGGRTVVTHMFVDDHDRDAEKWTFAQALRYLIVFHLLDQATADNWDDAGSIVTDGDVIDQTDAEVVDGEGLPLYLATQSDRPTAPVAAEKALAWALLDLPASLNCEGHSVAEAFVLLAHKSGTHFRVSTENRTGTVGEGEDAQSVQTDKPVDRLRWWARGAGTVRQLLKESMLATRNIDASELFSKVNVQQLQVTADHSEVITKPIVLGDKRRYEVTVGLVPGWKADANLDVNPGDSGAVLAAMAYADAHDGVSDIETLQEDPYYQRYHTAGRKHSDYTAVGRRWVLNETGRYTRESYARSHGYYNAGRYAPWEPSSPYKMPAGSDADAWSVHGLHHLVIGDDGVQRDEAVEAGAWSRIGRPFMDAFSAEDGRSMGVYVEFSCAGGKANTWRPLASNCRQMTTEAGIHIEAEDLWALKGVDASGDETNFWEAFIKGNTVVRVTAVIEGDGRLTGRADVSRFQPIVSSERARLFDLSERYHSNDPDGGNSIFRNAAATDYYKPNTVKSAGVDLNLMQGFVNTLMEVCSRRQIAVNATIPWLETHAYHVGDCIDQVAGMGLELNLWAAAQQQRHVDIVGIEYAPGATTILLDDFRLLGELLEG